MNIPWELLAWMAGLGALGGFINCFLAGEFQFPKLDKEAGVWQPGWVGTGLVGAAAAVVVWGIYGPFASFDLAKEFQPHITLSQLLSSLVVGMGGARILSLETQKIILKSEKEAEKEAKLTLAKILVKESRSEGGGGVQ
jgi:hypothetical protein